MAYSQTDGGRLKRAGFAVKRTSVRAPGDLDEAWILNAFDEAGRALMQRHAREDGVPLGFDVLEVDLTGWGRHQRPATVTVTATLVERQGSCHAVRFTAGHVPSASTRTAGEHPLLLARAAGWIWTPSLGPLSGSFAPTSSVGLWDRA